MRIKKKKLIKSEFSVWQSSIISLTLTSYHRRLVKTYTVNISKATESVLSEFLRKLFNRE